MTLMTRTVQVTCPCCTVMFDTEIADDAPASPPQRETTATAAQMTDLHQPVSAENLSSGDEDPEIAAIVRRVMQEINDCSPGYRLAEVPTLFAFGPIYLAIHAERARLAAQQAALRDLIATWETHAINNGTVADDAWKREDAGVGHRYDGRANVYRQCAEDLRARLLAEPGEK